MGACHCMRTCIVYIIPRTVDLLSVVCFEKCCASLVFMSVECDVISWYR